MDQFDGLLGGHFKLRHPGRSAFFEEAFEGFVDTATKFAFGERASHMRSARGATVGEGEDVIDGKRDAELVDPTNHLANAVLADLLKFGELAEQHWIGSIEKVAKEMDFVPIHLSSQFAGRNKFDASGVAGNGGASATFDGVVIGQRDGFEAVAAGLRGQFFGSVGPVRKIGMEMEVSEHELLHDASRAEQLSFDL